MNETFDRILETVAAHLSDPQPVEQPLITSNHFTGWVKGRIQPKQQVIVNALICPERMMQERLDTIRHQIQQEFNEISQVSIISSRYTDLDLMKEVIESLIQHFDVSFSVEDTIIKIGQLSDRREEWEGYLILTVINTHVIV